MSALSLATRRALWSIVDAAKVAAPAPTPALARAAAAARKALDGEHADADVRAVVDYADQRPGWLPVVAELARAAVPQGAAAPTLADAPRARHGGRLQLRAAASDVDAAQRLAAAYGPGCSVSEAIRRAVRAELRRLGAE